MPVTNGIGHSVVTPDKQQGLSALLGQQMNIVQAVLNKHQWALQRFVYIDTNAGDGTNAREGCEGSPVIFLRTALDKGIDYDAHFIDIVPGHTKALESATAFTNHKRIYTGDQKDIVPLILDRYPNKKTYGLVYTDPNGLPDFDMLAEVSRRQSKLDILIRISGTSYKRVSAANASREETRIDLGEELIKINKGNWVIRDLRINDKFHWTFLFGTDYTDFKAWKAFGFHRLDSEQGATIFQRLNLTSDEMNAFKQSSLFDSPRNQALNRSAGNCEYVCGGARCSSPVTEVHHFKYQNATAKDIIAVCHKCHCNIHGVLN